VNPRLDFTAGTYLGLHSQGRGIARPKAVVHYDAGGGNQFAALAYPMFQTQNADLLPVESWAKPFDLESILGGDETVIDSYELTWERTTGRGSLLSATAFYRRGRSLLIPIVDPATAPVVTRLSFDRGEILGGELAAERYLTRNLALRVFGRLQDTSSKSSPGELPYIPRWTAGGRLDYQDRRGIRSFAAVNYIGSRVHQEFIGGPVQSLSGYLSVDFRVSWQENLHRNYFIQVTDLFDRGAANYRGYPSAGRTLVGGIEFRF
jgi:outer membrane receptor protein involved in Fe transport